MISITSNRAKWIKRANDTASVFRRQDVQREVKRSLTRGIHQMNKRQVQGRGIGKSGRFVPLAPATVAKKGHDKPLIDRGKLFGQLTRGGSVKAGFVPSFGVFQYTFTVNTKPAGLLQWLQKGTRNMPARPPIDPTDAQADRLSMDIWKAIKRAWKRIGWYDRMGSAALTGFDRIDVDG